MLMDVEAAMKSHEQQRQSDKAHHEGRIAWLTEDAPRFACGTLVPKHLIANLMTKSHEALRYINEHGMSTNSAPTPDESSTEPSNDRR